MFEELSEKQISECQGEQVEHWKKIDLLNLCVTEREGKPSFVFYEGPPTANGKPGIHHVMARTLKDSINRYKTMQGYQVKEKGRMGHARTACRDRSREAAQHVGQTGYREIRYQRI